MDEEEQAKQLTEMKALASSNSALRCLLSLQSHRSGGMMFRGRSKEIAGDASMDLSERYERLIGAVKLLKEDLRMERRRSQLQESHRFRVDIVRFLLFVAGGFVIMAIFEECLPTD